MIRGLRSTAAIAGLLGACFVGSSSAAKRVSAPVPSLASVVLATSDFAPGAHVAMEKSATLAGQPAFVRAFKTGAKLGGQPLLMAISVGWLEPDATTARADFVGLQRETQTKVGRQAIAKAWGTSFIQGGKVRLKSTVVSPPVSLGDGGLRLALTITTNVGTVRMAIGFVQTDRVLDFVVLAAPIDQKVATSDITRAMSAVRQHLRAAFTVASTSPPTIVGTPQQGQPLTVDEGAWTGAPSGFTYVWSRCDAVGSTCAPIAGATANAYVPDAGDSGMTIRVTVTGSNAVGSQQATSLQSAPIP
jgi:hypothetical protein